MCLKPESLYVQFLLKVFGFSNFSPVAKIQTIVSSKQPIVSTLSALVKSIFNSLCFDLISCSNPVMFVVNNTLITTL